MQRNPRVIRSVVAFLFFVPLAAGPSYDGAAFEKRVAAIAAGADRAARRAAITAQLDALGVPYRLEDFNAGGRTGVNILVSLPAPPGVEQEILLGAHSDRVEVGQGAVDDASGDSAVLELLAAFKRAPLAAHRLSAAFFDLEELGAVGSGAFVAAHGHNLPAIYLNFDVFAYGDTLWVGSVNDQSLSARAMREAAAAPRFPLVMGPDYPPGDDRVFVAAKVETLGFALIDGREIKSILEFFHGGHPDPLPRGVTILHSANDTPDKIAGADAARALPVVERAIRLMDAAVTAACRPPGCDTIRGSAGPAPAEDQPSPHAERRTDKNISWGPQYVRAVRQFGLADSIWARRGLRLRCRGSVGPVPASARA